MMKKCMTAAGVLVALLALGTGCNTTKISEQGGIVQIDEGFSITVPTS